MSFTRKEFIGLTTLPALAGLGTVAGSVVAPAAAAPAAAATAPVAASAVRAIAGADPADYDFTLVRPVFQTLLQLPRLTVLQWFGVDEDTGEIWATQAIPPATGNSESFALSRLSHTGQLLDHMILTSAGHGTTVGIQRIDGRPYVWTNWNHVDAGNTITGNRLVRLPYLPGETVPSTHPEIETLSSFTTSYVTPVLDPQNGTVGFRISDTAGQRLQLRRIDDVVAGVDAPIGVTIQIPGDLVHMQGFAVDGTDAYWYSGDTNSATYPSEITRFSFTDGQVKTRVTRVFGEDPEGGYRGNFREPESIFLHKDKLTGRKTLFAGVVTGEQGRRRSKVYAFPDLGADAFTGQQLQPMQPHPLTEQRGRHRMPPSGLTQLAALRDPGSYYFSSAAFAALADRPASASASGYLLDVGALTSHGSGGCRQTLTRYGTGTLPEMFVRIVTETGATSPWGKIAVASA
ncbi:hypothetical protein ABIQ69_13150 [Agromyces sp. G08B096]|uniref:P68 RBP/TagC-like beta-propeller domain-containing protein n=1 Tax=Agromyces sp. G08B096 TaxID=3156399 RepID=A0AAU7W744_9MICO